MLTSLLWLLFDWRGRISRGTYRVGLLLTVLINETVAYATDAPQTTRVALAGVSLVIVMALEAKRFHDIGLSAAWIFWVNLPTVPLGLLIQTALPDVFSLLGSNDASPLSEVIPNRSLLPGIMFGLGLGSTVKGLWLSFARSMTGENGYAPASQGDKVGLNADLASAVDRAIAERKAISTPQPDAPASLPRIPSVGAPAARAPQRSFGKRGLSPERIK